MGTGIVRESRFVRLDAGMAARFSQRHADSELCARFAHIVDAGWVVASPCGCHLLSAARRNSGECASRDAKGGREMNWENGQKVSASHLTRNAYLHVRQSTIRQVFENTES